MSISYQEWSAKWAEGRKYRGTQLSEPELSSRIKDIVGLGNIKVPLAWERTNWAYLQQSRYRRGDENDPQPEHKLEKELFDRTTWEVKGGRVPMSLSPELNEISLENQRHGRRKIDVLAVLKRAGKTIPLAIEMKAESTNSCWFAVVENLQQVLLLRSYPQPHLLLNQFLKPFVQLPLSDAWGMVLAPLLFFTAKGQKGNSFRQAKDLTCAIRKQLDVTILLAAFDSVRGQIVLQTDDQNVGS
jgi:hypothetical protein